MKKYSGHKLKKFPDGHDLRGECVLNPCRPPMKGGHTHNHTYNAAYTAVFGRHSLRRIPRDKKKEWRMVFEYSYSYKQYPNLFRIHPKKER